MLFQKTKVSFSACTWQLTVVYNSRFRGSNALFWMSSVLVKKDLTASHAIKSSKHVKIDLKKIKGKENRANNIPHSAACSNPVSVLLLAKFLSWGLHQRETAHSQRLQSKQKKGAKWEQRYHWLKHTDSARKRGCQSAERPAS